MKHLRGIRMRRVILCAATLLVAAGSIIVTANPAAAQVRMDAEPLVDDYWRAGRHVTVITTVASDRLIEGVLRTRVEIEPRRDEVGPAPMSFNVDSGGAVVVDQPVEIPPGSEKQFVSVMPAEYQESLFDGGNWRGIGPVGRGGPMGPDIDFDVEVELVVAGEVVGSSRATVGSGGRDENVGVLPGLVPVEIPERIELAPPPSGAVLRPVPFAVLDAGPAALEQLQYLAGTPDELASLTDVQRQAVVRWIDGGGRLIVDGPPAAIAGFPAEWEPASGWVIAGRGEIRFSAGALANGQWASWIEPTTRTGGIDPRMGMMMLGDTMPPPPVSDVVGIDAGFRLPELGSLLVFLGIYVAIVGPLAFFVLAHFNRRNWVWFVVPICAVVFTAVFVAAGSHLRNTTEAAHSTLIEIGPGGSRAYTSALVGSVTGGRTSLHLGAGWSAESTESTTGTPTPPPAMTADADGLRADLQLEPGQFKLVRASGPAGYDSAVRVEAALDGTATITGRVVNDLNVDLHEVVVLVGYSSARVGTVPATASVEFEISAVKSIFAMDNRGMPGIGLGASAPELDHWADLTSDLETLYDTTCLDDCPMEDFGSNVVCGPNGCWPAAPTTTAPEAEPAFSTSIVSAPVWADVLRRDDGRLRSLGVVTAVGWTDELVAPATLDDGDEIRKGRTAVMTKGAIRADEPAFASGRRETVNELGMQFSRPPVPPGELTRAEGMVYRYVLPDEIGGVATDPSNLSIEFGKTVFTVRIWTPDGWQQYWLGPFLADERLDIPLPPGASRGGVVLLQTDEQPWQFARNNADALLQADWKLHEIDDARRAELDRELAEWRQANEDL